MSLVKDSKRAEAGRIMLSHQAAIEHHVAQIKLLKSEIDTIKTNFPDDAAEIDAILNSINGTIGSIK
jgi:2-C-methyl-D-erythritol 4-phosphate cytidylyltransferase